MKKSTIKIIAISLVMCLALGFVGWMTSGFTAFDKDSISEKFERKMNEDNLIYKEFLSAESYNSVDGDHGNGLVWTVNDDGSVTVDGTAEADDTFTLCTVTLTAGEYTFTSVKGGTKGTYFVQGQVDGVTVWYSDWQNTSEQSATKSFEATQTVTISIVVKEGTEMKNVTFYPVIVEGDEVGNYYA